MMKERRSGWFLITIFILLQLVGLLVFSRMIKAKTNLLVKENHQLTAFIEKDNSLFQLEEDYHLIEEDVEVIDQVLPNKEKIVDFIDQLEKEATSSGVSLKISFNSQAAKTEAGGLKSISFNLNLVGSYYQIVRFIQKIEKMPQIVNIQRVSVQSPEGIEGENNTVLQMKVYIDPNF